MKLHNVVKPSVSFSDVVKTGLKQPVLTNVYSKLSKSVKNVKCVNKCVNVSTKSQGTRPGVYSARARVKPAMAKNKGPDTPVIPLKNKFTPLRNVPLMENSSPIIPTVKALKSNSGSKACKTKSIEKVKADASGNNGVLPTGTDDKYSLGLTFIAKKCDKLKRARLSVNNALFRKQNRELYGFIPLDGVPNVSVISKHKVPMEPLEAHRLLKSQNVANYLGPKIPVASGLRANVWAEKLKHYWDTQLVAFITYGFPLCINSDHTLIAEKINHKSASDFPQDINAYLEEEVADGAILGPFPQPPDNIHTSPFMSRDKPGSKNHRVIIDLSWPKGTSVNDGVDIDVYAGAEYILTFPTIDHITNRVLQCGKNCFIAKVDISRAFRHMPVDPKDISNLGLYWDGYYLDARVPFGYRTGSALFQRCSDSIRYLMAQSGHHVINYCDDFLLISNEADCQAAFDKLCHLLKDLGFKISEKKTSTSYYCCCMSRYTH